MPDLQGLLELMKPGELPTPQRTLTATPRRRLGLRVWMPCRQIRAFVQRDSGDAGTDQLLGELPGSPLQLT